LGNNKSKNGKRCKKAIIVTFAKNKFMDFEKHCLQVIDIAKNAGAFIRTERGKFVSEKIETKGKNDFVSYVDKTAEMLIVDGLKNVIAEAGFIAEEGTNKNKGAIYNWIIDPLDGTTNFIHGMPCFAISIGLLREQQLVLGVIYEINLDECFYAWENAPAYLNGTIIKVSDTNKLSDALLATGFPYYDYKHLKSYMALFEYYMQHTHGLRRLGSAATDLAYVACGRFEAFYEYGLQPWDVAAGAFIVQQAGGCVCDFSGGNNYLFGKEIIASNKNCFEEMKQTLKQHFK
jgi:myo-inositol-1(or 4)-monophosphatase